MPHHLSPEPCSPPTHLARHYHSDLSIWLSVDPLADKYPSTSPYTYCANNPVRLMDPDGDSVIADKKAQCNIIYGLTKQEAKFVSFDENGILNVKKLNKSKSTSENMIALKALANSKTRYEFSVADRDLEGEPFRDMDENNSYYYGVTHIPNNVNDPSPDDNVYIITWGGLNEENQVANTAHEAYGHAYFYELSLQGQDVEYNHTWKTQLTKDGDCCVIVPSNHKLEQQIEHVTNQARTNYKSRKK